MANQFPVEIIILLCIVGVLLFLTCIVLAYYKLRRLRYRTQDFSITTARRSTSSNNEENII